LLWKEDSIFDHISTAVVLSLHIISSRCTVATSATTTTTITTTR